MSNIIVLDGVKIQLTNPDLDGDGKVGGVEKVTQSFGNSGAVPITEQTELGQSLEQLNDDSIDVNSKFSGIDLRSRLGEYEVIPILALDSLVSLGVLPEKCLNFTRSKKRLNVSIQGKGRDDIVNVVSGKREQEANSNKVSFGEKIGGFFKKNEK